MRLILFVAVCIWASGCAATLGNYQAPCDVEHVAIRLRSAKNTDNYCSTYARLDPGEHIGENTYSFGCAFKDGDNATIVLSEEATVDQLAHEVRHLLDWFCKLKPKSKTPQPEWKTDPREVDGIKQWVKDNTPKDK